MRDFISFVASLAGAAMLTALDRLVPIPTFWRRVLLVASLVFFLCAGWLAVDFISENGLGMWIGLNWPIWARGLVGALVGAFVWVALTTHHSIAQSNKDQPQPPSPSSVTATMADQYDADAIRVMDEALADPRYSAETKLVISHKKDLVPLKREYRELRGNVSLRSPDAIAFFNRRLRETGKNWQITPQNIDSTFGNVMLDSSAGGARTGIKIKGGGGNTFDQMDIRASQTGIDLENTNNNQFGHTRVSGPGTTSAK